MISVEILEMTLCDCPLVYSLCHQ